MAAMHKNFVEHYPDLFERRRKALAEMPDGPDFPQGPKSDVRKKGG